MNRNIVKLVALIIVTVLSLEIAASTVREIVVATEQKEKTMADAMIKHQVELIFEEVQKEIKEVLEQESITIETEELEMKPVEEELEEVAETEIEIEESEEVVEEAVEEEKDEAENEEEDENDDEDIQGEIVDSIIDLGHYLVEYYFLDGYIYYQQEENEALKARKLAVHHMEVPIIQSLIELKNTVPKLLGFDIQAIQELKEAVIESMHTFESVYDSSGYTDEIFNEIYQNGLLYFEAYIEALEAFEALAQSIAESANPVLVMGIILQSVETELIPAAMNVLDAGLDLKDYTNRVYVEGIEDIELLTREEVIALIQDPISNFESLVIEYNQPEDSPIE